MQKAGKIRLGFVVWTIIAFLAALEGYAAEKSKNILIINSYHQGFAWTDSLNVGITNVLKEKGMAYFVEYLNSKQFGKSNFEAEKNLIRDKYSQVKFDGVLVTDNDALDFVFQYDDELFPDVPVIFGGISNPEYYPLEGTNYRGFKETSNTDSIIDVVRLLLPESKNLLVIADYTTTGEIYRKELARQKSRFDGLIVSFPQRIDVNSICEEVRSTTADAIFYISVNQDQDGNPVLDAELLEKIGKISTVPLFANDPLYIGKGVVGGLFQSGKIHGTEAAKLLVRLVESPSDSIRGHIFRTEQGYFFDHKMLNKYGISLKKLPKRAIISNRQSFFNPSNFGLLIAGLFIAGLVIVILSVVNRRRRNKLLKNDLQLLEIENQKNELQQTFEQLGRVISELENANLKLKEINNSLLDAKKKAEESDNLKSAFLANVSHEIRTPLNSIVGFSSLLCEEGLDEPTRRMYADLIESNTESLLVLIDEIIDLSKIEAQQLTLKMQEFSVNSLMMELFQIFSHSHQGSAIQLKMKSALPNKELFVFSDRVRVKQIFINLLSNAYKFTDTGLIEMGCFIDGDDEIILYVKDTGIGIKREDHQAIFQRFRKLNVSSGRIYRGTGLGLAITHKLIELLGGKIWIESEPEKGSTFFFTLKGCTFKDDLRL